MLIQAPCVVAMVWTLSTVQGELIDELTSPVEFFYGGDDLFAKVEEVLAGQDAGFETTVHLEPEQAFGDYDSSLVCFEERGLFPPELETGMQFEGLPPGAQTPDMPQDVLYTVTEVYASHVVLDGNHPLAGIALRLALKVLDVRAASEDEVQAGSVGEPGISLLSPSPAPPNTPLH